MGEASEFEGFIRRVRAGDEDAARELVRRYEPAIRLEVRMRLRDPRLQRVLDSTDVCQSVLASFFVRAASGQYDLDDPANLIRLLVKMTRNKVAEQARWQAAERRDVRRMAEMDDVAVAVADGQASPSRVASGRELLGVLRGRLSEEEREIMDLRCAGHDWGEIAQRIGGTAEARRKQHARAIDRVARDLGLEGDGDA
jgi:RNA polymerase sigma-70 factor (ECF subfamily)